MLEGADWSYQPPTVAELRAAAKRFAVRYASRTPQKNLTRAEAAALEVAGIDVAVIWQEGKTQALRGRAGGRADADAARAFVAAVGGPPAAPVYFAVDFDAAPGQMDAVMAYGQGWADVYGKAKCGPYGGLRVVTAFLDAGFAYAWQTVAWSGGVWDPRAQLQQYRHAVPLGSGVVDLDRATTADFGQWAAHREEHAMRLVSRADWGARPALGGVVLVRAAQRGTAVHYSGMDADEQADHANCAKRVKAIQAVHMDSRGWVDIAYSYLACKHGYVFEGRGRGVRTAAQGTTGGNESYHAVCFLGDDSAGRDDVTDAGRAAVKAAVLHCNAWSAASEVRPHSWFHATGCPGDDLRAWIAAGMPTIEEDDMAGYASWTPEDKKAFLADLTGAVAKGSDYVVQTFGDVRGEVGGADTHPVNLEAMDAKLDQILSALGG